MSWAPGRKAYGSIGHLPGSRTGPGDHHLDPGQAALLTSRPLAPGAEVLVQEKLDGSCVRAARVGDQILALGRDGSPADSSPNEGRRLWARWAASSARACWPSSTTASAWSASGSPSSTAPATASPTSPSSPLT